MASGTIPRIADFANPIGIGSNTDLDDLTTFGVYNCTASTVAATLSNTPVTGSGFSMLVMWVGGTRVVQMIVYGSNIYTRQLSSTGFSSWYRYTGTAV